jgi:CRP/FNR family transcriptional regulator, cyclic AMP receptor protein
MGAPRRDPFPWFTPIGDGTQFIDRLAGLVDRIDLFEGFDDKEVLRLASHMPCYRAPAGSILIGEGDYGDFGLFVMRGTVGVFKRDASGATRRIGAAGAGETLGEMSMIDGQPRTASCIADDEVEFAVLDRDGLITIIADDPKLGAKVLIELVQHLSAKLRSASKRLAEKLAV